MSALVYLPAGRSLRRSDTAKWVDPQPEKGIIELGLDQGIINFVWRNKETSRAEDELLIFPGEAAFERVKADPTGRSFALKFNSSNQVHFFWLQRGTLGDADARATTDIDEFLKDPNYRVGSAPIQQAHLPPKTPAPASGTRDAPGAPKKEAGAEASGSGGGASSEAGPSDQSKKNSDMARLLFQWAENNIPIPDEDEASLTDILTPETVSRLVGERPELASELAQHMPPDLELPGGESVSSAAGLQRVVGTPQFRDAVSNLEMALRSGMLPDSMMPWARNPAAETSGGAWNLRSFLAALRDVAKDDAKDDAKDKDDDKMETD